MAKINVAHVVFRDLPGELVNTCLAKRNEETHPGFDSHYFDEGMIVFYWESTSQLLMYPIDTIKSISITLEEE